RKERPKRRRRKRPPWRTARPLPNEGVSTKSSRSPPAEPGTLGPFVWPQKLLSSRALRFSESVAAQPRGRRWDRPNQLSQSCSPATSNSASEAAGALRDALEAASTEERAVSRGRDG